ncbi:MAG: hypothetical protein ACREQ5_11500 [Candidatus Dormibacteria bacterium]
MGPDDQATCNTPDGGCDGAVNHNPYTVDDVPTPGDFDCGGNCRHLVQIDGDAPEGFAPFSWSSSAGFQEDFGAPGLADIAGDVVGELAPASFDDLLATGDVDALVAAIQGGDDDMLGQALDAAAAGFSDADADHAFFLADALTSSGLDYEAKLSPTKDQWFVVAPGTLLEGGAGSGDRGHVGVHGHRGGSGPGDSAIAAKVLDGVRGETGGATVSLRGESPAGGYTMSAVAGLEKQIPTATLSHADIAAFIAKNRSELMKPGMHVGAWNEGPITFLDVSHNIGDRQTALDAAHSRNEMAVWDVKGVDSLYTMTDHLRPSDSTGTRTK